MRCRFRLAARRHSRVRTTVVPTATMRRLSLRARFTASAVCGADAVALAMQPHIVDALHAQRRKGAQAHVQRHTRHLDSSRGDALQHLRRKVQAGCRRCHRSALSRKDCLVALAVCRPHLRDGCRAAAVCGRCGPELRRSPRPAQTRAADRQTALARAPRLREQSCRLDQETQGARRLPLCGRGARARASDCRPAGSVSITSMRPVGFSFSRRSVRRA